MLRASYDYGGGGRVGRGPPAGSPAFCASVEKWSTMDTFYSVFFPSKGPEDWDRKEKQPVSVTLFLLGSLLLP